jgi:DNA-binding NtrC family response regulator
MKAKILIVDDEKPLRDTLARWFKPKYECFTAPDAKLAMQVVAENPDLSLMITDVKMPGESGVDLLKKAKEKNPSMACILLTAYGSVDLAVEAMKDGADDFFQKPVTDLQQFELRVDKAVKTASLKMKTRKLEKEVASLKSQLHNKLENFTGKSLAMEKVYALIAKAAPSNANVLIEGPSGTGKELVARALHNLSNRAHGPFVAVECAALSSTLLESELFGHVKGAFTDAYRDKVGRFEAAHGGTIFLDEISEIDMSTQVKLLRVLESRTLQRVGGTDDIKVDFRLVAATNRNLAKYVEEGKFREDLYYRLNVIDIKLPALKDRPGDIALLVSRFLNEFSQENANRVTGIDPQAMKMLEEYSWPGNVRQLRNVVEKMVILSSGGRLGVEDVPVEISSFLEESAKVGGPQEPSGSTLKDTEKNQILAALEKCSGNKSRAAEMLGISRRTLHRKFKDWNLK